MADNHDPECPSTTLNPVTEHGSIERGSKHNANKLEAEPQQHEYLVYPAEDIDGKEQLELHIQIHSATGGDEPHRVFQVGSEPEKIQFWVVYATPEVADRITKLSKV